MRLVWTMVAGVLMKGYIPVPAKGGAAARTTCAWRRRTSLLRWGTVALQHRPLAPLVRPWMPMTRLGLSLGASRSEMPGGDAARTTTTTRRLRYVSPASGSDRGHSIPRQSTPSSRCINSVPFTRGMLGLFAEFSLVWWTNDEGPWPRQPPHAPPQVSRGLGLERPTAKGWFDRPWRAACHTHRFCEDQCTPFVILRVSMHERTDHDIFA